MDAERCSECDQILATQADYDACPDGCECPACVSKCWSIFEGTRCNHEAVDWRSRALISEGRLRTLERMGIQSLFPLYFDANGVQIKIATNDYLDAWTAAHPEVQG